MNKRRVIQIVLYSLAAVLAIYAIFNKQIESMLVDSYHPQITERSVAKNEKSKGNFDFSNAKFLNLQTAAKARMDKSNIKVIGSIAIPSIKLYLPIGKGVSNDTLALEAGTMKANQKMGQGNYTLAGHHMIKHDLLFSPLYYKSKVGQRIYLSDAKDIYEYKINQRTFIQATDLQVINDVPGKKIVTLITCDKTGAGRLMIRGNYQKKWAFKKAPISIQKDLNKHFNNSK